MLNHEYTHVNGIRLHYVTAGNGLLLLFLHGFPSFWYTWRDQLAAFSSAYRVVAPDLRGYNLSDKPMAVDQYPLTYLVEDIRALIDSLDQRPCVLIGHDWGGIIAWASAAAYPEYLDKLIVINQSPLNITRRGL
jgi:epoxide hydrolase 4